MKQNAKFHANLAFCKCRGLFNYLKEHNFVNYFVDT